MPRRAYSVFPKKFFYYVLPPPKNGFVAVFPRVGSRLVIGTLPMKGYSIVEKPMAGIRGGWIALEGLKREDAIARVKRANAVGTLDRHLWN